MCGIAGIMNFDSDIAAISDLNKMTDAIAHRGPDGDGHWISPKGNVGFGHRRLSIIDLSENGKQPMHYANNRYTITFNGEIYNYIELRNELRKKGYNFFSNTDTEVLLALYDDKKERCLQHLDGMFAFSIWDEKEQQLFCARDRFGEKPFYYTKLGEQFLFASEIKALWAAGVPKVIKPSKVNEFILSGAVDDSTETFFDSIFKLSASTYFTVSAKGVMKFNKYWNLDLRPVTNTKNINDLCAEFEDKFFHSLSLRLRSDVTVGTSLSGGVDSSYIVACINQLLKGDKNINSFSAKFPGFERDESYYIKTVTDHIKTIIPYDVFPDGNGLLVDFQRLCKHQEEPFQSASIYAQYKVFELARRNNTIVLIDGQGADELLAGYIPYYKDYLNQLFFWDSSLYKRELAQYAILHGDYAPIAHYKNDENLRMRLGRYKQKILGTKRAYPQNYLKEILKRDITGINLQTLLRYADRNSMAHSVEVRLPFLNHHLVEWIFTLPDSVFLNHGWPKYILRRSANRFLPHEVVWRKRKVGYEPPQQKWINSKEFTIRIEKAKSLLGYEKSMTEENDAWSNSRDWRYLMAYMFVED